MILNLIKRIKTAWRLSKYPDIQDADTLLFTKDSKIYPWNPPVEGDGKAVFIGEGTEADYEEQEKMDEGIFGLFGTGKRKPEIITHDEI